MGLGIAVLLGALVQRFHRLGEITLPVVEAGQLHVDRRVVRAHLARLVQHLLGALVVAALLVDVGQAEVAGGLGSIWIMLKRMGSACDGSFNLSGP